MGNIRLHYRSAEHSGVKLDEYLIPVLSLNDIEEEAERIILNMIPEGLQDPRYLSAALFAERLGLKVIHLPLYKKKQTSSIQAKTGPPAAASMLSQEAFFTCLFS